MLPFLNEKYKVILGMALNKFFSPKKPEIVRLLGNKTGMSSADKFLQNMFITLSLSTVKTNNF